MRRFILLSTLCLAAGVVSACKPDQEIASPVEPKAGVRFINAVPDSGGANGLDFRFVDYVENSAAYNVPFRNLPQSTGSGAAQVTASALIELKPAKAGQRHFRIFLSDTLQSIASTVLMDGTQNLEAGHNYTFLLWGNARSAGADKMRLSVIDETVADPAARVALRVINATANPIDVRQYAASGTVPTTAPTWAGLAGLSISNYQLADTTRIRFNVQPAGGGTALVDVLALIGQPNGTAVAGCVVGLDCQGAPGTTASGSAVTLIVFPPTATGYRAASFSSTGSSFMWDRRPPLNCTVSFGC